MSHFKCQRCQHIWQDDSRTSTTTGVRDGQVRIFDDNQGEYITCDKCGGYGQNHSPNGIGAPGLSFTDSGTGKKVVK